MSNYLKLADEKLQICLVATSRKNNPKWFRSKEPVVSKQKERKKERQKRKKKKKSKETKEKK